MKIASWFIEIYKIFIKMIFNDSLQVCITDSPKL